MLFVLRASLFPRWALCRAQHTIDVRVKLQEERFRLGDVLSSPAKLSQCMCPCDPCFNGQVLRVQFRIGLNLDTFDSKSFSTFAESRKASDPRPLGKSRTLSKAHQKNRQAVSALRLLRYVLIGK